MTASPHLKRHHPAECNRLLGSAETWLPLVQHGLPGCAARRPAAGPGPGVQGRIRGPRAATDGGGHPHPLAGGAQAEAHAPAEPRRAGLDAFPDYWRKASVKRIVMRSIPDEATRAAAVKTGEVDLAYLFGPAIASDLKRTPGT